jgi:heme exporter protein D
MDELKQVTLVQWVALAILLLTVASQSDLLAPYAPYLVLALALTNAVLAWLNNRHAGALKRTAALLDVTAAAQARREARREAGEPPQAAQE